MDEAIRTSDIHDIRCNHCGALHPLSLPLGSALACMDRLNNTRRPCPACGAREQWVLRRRQNEEAR